MPRIKSKPIKEGAELVEMPAPDGRTPQGRAKREIMASIEKRTILAEAYQNALMAVRMPRVKSNAELEQRIDEYFSMASQRKIPATVEELALYIGYTSQTMNAWKNGQYVPFHDGEEFGLTTMDIIKRAYDIMHMADAVLAETGSINPVSYIFRSKNYYNMQDKQEIVLSPETNHSTMTREQIEEMARGLPDATDADGYVK